jgi:single-stranded-DNA-specific exonuclease
VRVRLKSGVGKFVTGIAFRAVGTPLGQTLLDNRGRAVHAAGHLTLDRWQGEARVQLRISDVAASESIVK